MPVLASLGRDKDGVAPQQQLERINWASLYNQSLWPSYVYVFEEKLGFYFTPSLSL